MILEWCRTANVWLGVLTAFSLGAMLHVGRRRGWIRLTVLFLEFCAAMVLVGVGSHVAQTHGSATSPITACWTGLLVAINATCFYYIRKDPS